MNPSASGWIKKLLKEVADSDIEHVDSIAFYKQLKETGFIYGSNVKVLPYINQSFDFTEEERSKVNVMLCFYHNHVTITKNNSSFIEYLVDYYKILGEDQRSFFQELFGEKSKDKLLENMIHKRIHIDDNIISKSFNYFLVNALLFIDVLGYNEYLNGEKNIAGYVNNLESALESMVLTVLDTKSNKTDYDENLMKLFESSMRQKETDINTYEDVIKLINDPLEKHYLIDLVCMASWSDRVIDSAEKDFLNKIKDDLNLEQNVIDNSIASINDFYKNHKAEVAFLSSKNLAQSFYDNSSKIVSRLINRNRKRLIKELSESKEAMKLLTASTHRNLSDDEQKKVQQQLLDIFKSIPSLAIFMLPGGALLLPLFVKIIPKLLPSAFDDNRIDD
ncbi:LETM1-related biofilm-associated protein [Winogradskyella sp.]|uniref:LETM1-related biofilm-associated protein n=1 Tax=Winogradskyella sp. TaxID=1883156 RepID=UPI003F6AC164